MRSAILILGVVVLFVGLTVSPALAKFPLNKAFIIDPWDGSGVVPNNLEVAVDGLNRIHVAWQVSSIDSSYWFHLYYRCYDTLGNPLCDVVDLTSPGSSATGCVSVAANSWGKVAVSSTMMYGDKRRRSYLWMSDNSGVFQPPVEYDLDRQPTEPGVGNDIAINELGQTIIVWQNSKISSGDSLYYAMYDKDNQRIGYSRSASSHSSGEYYQAAYPAIAISPSGRFVLVWDTDREVISWPFYPSQPTARVFDVAGNPVTDEIIVACEGYPETCSGDSTYFYQGNAAGHWCSASIQDNGDFAVAYRKDYDWDCRTEHYFARQFTAQGVPKGPNFLVSDRSNCYVFPWYPFMLSDSVGNLTCVFHVNVAGGVTYFDNYAQRFDYLGKRIGDNYRINDVPGKPYEAAIDIYAADMNRNGLVAVVWWDWGSLAPGWNLLMQTMDVSDIGYTCGDANDDKRIDISDAVYLIDYIFSGGYAPKDVILGDDNSDGVVDISDVVALISYIFSDGILPRKCQGQ